MKTLSIIQCYFILLTTIGISIGIGVVEAAHARKRPSASNLGSRANTYDRQITTFDPQGHLLQVQYAQRASERGSSGLFLKLTLESSGEDVIVAVVASDNTNASANANAGGAASSGGRSNQDCKRNPSMYRLHDGIMAKMTGLQGDARLLSNHLLANALRMNRFEGGGGAEANAILDTKADNEESAEQILQKVNTRITVKQLAHVCANVQHSLTMRSGARPLAVDAVLFGLDGRKHNGNGQSSASGTNANQFLKLGLHRSRVTGSVEECHFCVLGNISKDRITNEACLHELEVLWSQGMATSKTKSKTMPTDVNEGKEEVDIEIPEDDDSYLTRSITKMGELLIHHGQKIIQSTQEEDSSAPLPVAVDIYVVRPDAKGRGGIQIECATCVKEKDLEHVAGLFVKDTRE